MSANITIREDGTAEAMYAEQPAWHRFGTVVEEAPNSAKALELAQLNWQVSKHPNFTAVDIPFDAKDPKPTGKLVQVPGSFATVRDDNGLILGTVGSRYRIFQNVEAFDFLDNLVDQEELKYESAGSLDGGRVVWMLARMKEAFFVSDDDPINHYALICNGHDGSQVVTVALTDVRVVCNNTLQMALHQTKRTRNQFTIKHTTNMKRKLSVAKEALGFLVEKRYSLESILKQFADKPAPKDLVTEYLERMFPVPTVKRNGDDVSERTKERILGIRDTVEHLYNDHEFQNTKAARGTVFGLLNATTQWVDHERSVRGENEDEIGERRFLTAMFGRGNKIKGQALSTLQDMVGVNPE